MNLITVHHTIYLMSVYSIIHQTGIISSCHAVVQNIVKRVHLRRTFTFGVKTDSFSETLHLAGEITSNSVR